MSWPILTFLLAWVTETFSKSAFLFLIITKQIPLLELVCPRKYPTSSHISKKRKYNHASHHNCVKSLETLEHPRNVWRFRWYAVSWCLLWVWLVLQVRLDCFSHSTSIPSQYKTPRGWGWGGGLSLHLCLWESCLSAQWTCLSLRKNSKHTI